MHVISAQNLVVEFPMYAAAHRSLKKTVLHASTGGRIAQDARARVTVRALDGISFIINSGDRVGLVGHNGSGKTTLLRVLAGAYEPVVGKLEIVGRVASLLDIAMGMDNDATGYENIVIRGIMMGLSPAEMRTRIEEIAEFSELGEYLNMPVRTYSAGMQMRLAFAVSTSISADILLMDEWLSIGDEQFNEKASKRLDAIIAQSKALIIASHSPELIAKLCNRGIRLQHGRLEEEFAP